MANPINYSKKFDKVEHCDVLVAGGGIAGINAAITAARAGAETVLLERYGFFGGAITTWGNICFCADTNGVGEVFYELIGEMEQIGAIDAYVPFNPELILSWNYHTNWHDSLARLYDPNALRIIAAQMVRREPNLRVLLHTRVVDVITQDNNIDAVLFHNVSGLQAIKPGVVVDCTGDAHLVGAAGLSCVENRENDGRPVPMALRISLRDTGKKVEPALPAWGKKYDKEAETLTVFTRNQNGRILFRSNVVGYNPLQADELTQAEISCQTNVLNIVNYLQRHGYENCELDSISIELGIRIGRRIIGRHTLNNDDVLNAATFDDAIACGTANLSSFLDVDSIAKGHEQTHKPIKPYHIPYRCLFPVDSKNVLTAGRSISADWWPLSSARMAPTCAMTGQAAGLAAAQSLQQSKNVTDIDISVLQKELRAKGAKF